MEIVYETERVKEICTSLKEAKRHFGGDEKMAAKLHARVNALAAASTMKDIVVQPLLHFHPLVNKGRRQLDGYFAIDVAGRKCPWRLIVQPLDGNKEPFNPCNIDEIAGVVEIVGIMEVSNHYE